VQPDFWHDRWRIGKIGFHQAAVDSNLEEYWPQLALNPDSRVFVPLCGKTLDMIWLRDRGHSVTGVEISTMALESFFMEQGVLATRLTAGKFDVYQADRLRLLQGDFFALTAERLGTVDAVYDRAALISWAPELRDAYVAQMTALTAPGTQTLLITVDYPQQQMPGPPFSLPDSEVHRLYSPHHEIQLLDRRDILPKETRFQTLGVTQLHEASYRLTRI
jgi:thiopurine S-methyltransferase